MTQREIDRAAAIIRATPIEKPLPPLAPPARDPFWRYDFPGILAVLFIAAIAAWAISRLP